MSEAMRDNKGKPKMSYFMRSFPRMARAIARVKEMGGIKYEEGNWKKGNKPDEEYWDSMFRHLDYIYDGEMYDQDTGCLHIAHAVWNMCALLELNYHDLPVIDEKLFAERAAHWGKVRAEREQAEKDAKFGEALSSLFIKDEKIADVVQWEAVLTVNGVDMERASDDCDDLTGCLDNCADCDVDCPDNVEANSEPAPANTLDDAILSAVSPELWAKHIQDSAEEAMAAREEVPPETSRHVSIPEPMDFTFTYADAEKVPDYLAIEKRLNAPPLPQEQEAEPKDIVFTIKDREKLPSFVALEKQIHEIYLRRLEQEARTQEEADKILHEEWKKMTKTIKAEAELNDAIIALGAERVVEVAQEVAGANHTSPSEYTYTNCPWMLDQAEWSRCDTTDFPG